MVSSRAHSAWRPTSAATCTSATRADTNFTDPGNAGYWYRLCAVDVKGNASEAVLLGPNGTLSVDGTAPLTFALRGARPNPSHGDRLDVETPWQARRPRGSNYST